MKIKAISSNRIKSIIRTFNYATEKGLRVHQAKLNCGCGVLKQYNIAKLQIGKMPDDTGPESHRSAAPSVSESLAMDKTPKSQDRVPSRKRQERLVRI